MVKGVLNGVLEAYVISMKVQRPVSSSVSINNKQFPSDLICTITCGLVELAVLNPVLIFFRAQCSLHLERKAAYVFRAVDGRLSKDLLHSMVSQKTAHQKDEKPKE